MKKHLNTSIFKKASIFYALAAEKQAAGFVFVCLEDRTILLAKRSQNSSEPGTWAGLGGTLNPGEDAKEGAIREVEEEAGSMPEIKRILKKVDIKRPGLVFTTFIAELSLDEKRRWKPKLNFEHDTILWTRKLPDNIHKGLLQALSKALVSSHI